MLLRGAARATTDEQPIDAAAFVLAFRGAYLATGDRHYLRRMRHSFAWFLGANRLGLSLYDATTGGCRDGLGETQWNENQGAESTVCFLLSLIENAGAGRRVSKPLIRITRTAHRLLPDPRRVIAKPYLPGEEISLGSDSRTGFLMARVLAIPDEQVHSLLSPLMADFRDRHADFEAILLRHFDVVAHHIPREGRGP